MINSILNLFCKKEKPVEVLTTINNSDFYGLSNGNGTENG